MPSKQERKSGPETGQEDETTPEKGQASDSTASAEEVSSKAATRVEAIDEVLDEFDDLTLAELGFRKEDKVDSAKVDEAIKKKVKGFVQKGGQ